MSSYYVAFSNDSREWTVLDDGYAEWVGYQNVIIFVIVFWLPNLSVVLKEKIIRPKCKILSSFTHPQVVSFS